MLTNVGRRCLCHLSTSTKLKRSVFPELLLARSFVTHGCSATLKVSASSFSFPRKTCAGLQQKCRNIFKRSFGTIRETDRQVGEFLTGGASSRRLTFLRRFGFSFLGISIVVCGMVAAFGVDELLEHVGITKPSLALKLKSLDALEEMEIVQSVLGPRLVATTGATVERQMLVKGVSENGETEYRQRIKFEVAGSLGRGFIFAEGDVEGNVLFLALEMDRQDEAIELQNSHSAVQSAAATQEKYVEEGSPHLYILRGQLRKVDAC